MSDLVRRKIEPGFPVNGICGHPQPLAEAGPPGVPISYHFALHGSCGGRAIKTIVMFELIAKIGLLDLLRTADDGQRADGDTRARCLGPLG